MSIFQEEERKASGKKQYTVEVFIPTEIYDRVNWLLSFDGDMSNMSDEEIREAGMNDRAAIKLRRDCSEEIFRATFEDGATLSYTLVRLVPLQVYRDEKAAEVIDF